MSIWTLLAVLRSRGFEHLQSCLHTVWGIHLMLLLGWFNHQILAMYFSFSQKNIYTKFIFNSVWKLHIHSFFNDTCRACFVKFVENICFSCHKSQKKYMSIKTAAYCSNVFVRLSQNSRLISGFHFVLKLLWCLSFALSSIHWRMTQNVAVWIVFQDLGKIFSAVLKSQ